MSIVRYDNDPLISDTVLIEIDTTDADGTAFNPYRVDTVTIYFLERNYADGSIREFTEADGQTTTYTSAYPVKTYGSADAPAWDSTAAADSELVRVDVDTDGNPLLGHFRLLWEPGLAREGDYFVCWTWTPLLAGTGLANYLRFYLAGDTRLTTTIPSHQTPPGKYEHLLDLYLPSMYKTLLATRDRTRDVLGRTNAAAAKGFSALEGLANQIVDLNDANVVHESMLPYLSNLFGMSLRGSSPALWRRQIKRAVPLYKRKGTLAGLTEAMTQANITVNAVTQYWQVASAATHSDGFRAEDGQTTFVLEKVPADPLDLTHFSVKVRFSGDPDYTDFSDADVTFDTADGITTMTWLGTPLAAGDYLLVHYRFATVDDDDAETYLQSLPLMDLRDETEVCYPRKNWNVHLIAESDPMFSVLCADRHPFHDPVVFGKVRTEFPYSENIYNMEEYNGSTRNSTAPCDIDLEFVDPCTHCLSSNISLDVEVSPLTDDRITEVVGVCKDYLPFHAVVHSINYSGGVNEYLLPPVESVDTYITADVEETVVGGNILFNRSIQPNVQNLRRDVLATATVAASGTGTGKNTNVCLYFPERHLEIDSIGLDPDNNVLHILSGLNAGQYQIENPAGSLADIVGGVPSVGPEPFPFHLSNVLYAGGGDVYQDDLVEFDDPAQPLTPYNVVSAQEGSPWKVVVSGGPHAGTYNVARVNNGRLAVTGWVGTSAVTGLTYDLRTAANATVVSGTTGRVAVTRRGRLEISGNLPDQYGVRPGDYLFYDDAYYQITETSGTHIAYLSGYAGGTSVGVPSLAVHRRLINAGVGYAGYRGFSLHTTVNHYSVLGVNQDVEDGNAIRNYLVLIGTNYYSIKTWEDTVGGDGKYKIELEGTPMPEWTTTGTAGVSYSLVRFAPNPVTVGGATFQVIDRRCPEAVTMQTETVASMSMAGPVLNAAQRGQPLELAGQQEAISIEIEWLDDQ